MRDIETVVRGNATADPIERRGIDGAPSASVRIAVTSTYRDPATGEWTDRKTEFITVFASRSLARNLLVSVKQGDALVVSGRLHTSEWTDEQDRRQFSLTIQAEAIGHDLNYGTVSGFSRPVRDRDVPQSHPYSGRRIEPDGSAEDTGVEASGPVLADQEDAQAEREPAEVPF